MKECGRIISFMILRGASIMGSVGDTNNIKNPLYRNNDIIREAMEELDRRAKKNQISEVSNEDIFVDRIISPQNYLERDRLQKDREMDAGNIPTIDVIKYKGEYIISDGNHRVVVAKENNVEKINANIIDLDKKPIRQKKKRS